MRSRERRRRRRPIPSRRAWDAARARRKEAVRRPSSSASRPARPLRAGAHRARRGWRARLHAPRPRRRSRRDRGHPRPASTARLPRAPAAHGSRKGRRRADRERASPAFDWHCPGRTARPFVTNAMRPFHCTSAPVPATAAMARSRSRLQRALRDHLEGQGYLEVETPIAVPFAGQEPHLRPFETRFTPDRPWTAVEGPRRLHLHTSPEYAMKRLLARPGFGKCYQLARVFRDGEISPSHNPEFTLLLLERVEPALGIERPTFLTEYPASQAALARLKPGDPSVAERFELYAGGLELANGFSELCDSREQRARLEGEQRLRAQLGREVFPLDEEFLAALDRIGE